MDRIFILNEQTLRLNIPLAMEIGLNESIAFLQFEWLIANHGVEREGRKWVFGSVISFQEKFFRFWSETTVKRTFNQLRENRLLMIGNFNKKRYDQTNWYSIDFEGARLLESIVVKDSGFEPPPVANGEGQNGPMAGPKWPDVEAAKMAKPIHKSKIIPPVDKNQERRPADVVSRETAPALGTRIKEAMDNGAVALTGEKIRWEGSRGKFGQALSTIMALTGDGTDDERFDVFHLKAEVLFRRCKADKAKNGWWFQQGFLYTTLAANWNKLNDPTVKKKETFPNLAAMADSEIASQAGGLFEKFGVEGIKKSISDEGFKAWAEKNFFLPALAGVLIQEKGRAR